MRKSDECAESPIGTCATWRRNHVLMRLGVCARVLLGVLCHYAVRLDGRTEAASSACLVFQSIGTEIAGENANTATVAFLTIFTVDTNFPLSAAVIVFVDCRKHSF